jgi:hypothetical protein
MKAKATVLHHQPLNLAGLRLNEIVDKRYYAYQDEPDAHQIVQDLGENHHYYAEDKADDSSDESQIRQRLKKTGHTSPPLVAALLV